MKRGLPQAAAAWAYFFDIDGTLVDIAAAPGHVRFDRDLRDLLARLHDVTGGAVALISGRSIADIDALFPESRLPAAGQHGTERRDAAGRLTRHAVQPERLDGARRRLAEVARRHRGLLLEDKGLSLALHYRSAPRLGGYAARLLRSVQAELGPAYCVLGGKRVVELTPAGRDKGLAVREFMEEAPFRGRVPVFLGDDVTDEYGFATVNRLGGLSIKVGPGPTAARWRLHGVRSVRAWLARGNGVDTPR
jgi:trehalose 6-phosphate phosphatase